MLSRAVTFVHGYGKQSKCIRKVAFMADEEEDIINEKAL